jgi:uncharacterized membrane protein
VSFQKQHQKTHSLTKSHKHFQTIYDLKHGATTMMMMNHALNKHSVNFDQIQGT